MTWEDYFLNIAKAVSLRSKDSETKVGCVIVSPNNHIIGTGYNSFIFGLPDEKLPNTRPEKYKWMLHAEQACLSNMVVSPWLYKEGVTAYITMKPCFSCLQKLISQNITKIVYDATEEPSELVKEHSKEYEFIVNNSKLELIGLKLN